ncbi:outer membrane protein OmpK [Pseudomonas sp. GV071]|uniref:outer membrane protein OmpK n=1 Tax=Pseudomonas sp. GV071 TaxID=2135754 RepID=UPI000D3B13B1|nr:outer membrane protein OmpK [Pseudomonas sp. GV071]PTQ67400.1 nucleoside-specific outer membrane channel protein Tsx [Pseudomonas sp. GV071]
MNKVSTLLLASGLALAATTAQADGPLLWQDNSATYLYGRDFKVNPAIQQTLSFEHASGWTFGDLFVFFDQINYNGTEDSNAGKNTYYGEFAPRLSFGKIFDQKLEFGPIKDVLLAGTYERGENRNQNYLLGPGFDLALPGFDYFQLNFYYRKPDGITKNPSGQWQVTPVWSYTIPVGNSDILIDGYMDWVWNNKDATSSRPNDLHANLHFNPQIKYDLGKAMGWTGVKHVYVGVEYDYWKNKYAIDNDSFLGDDILRGTTQSAINAIVKVHL